MEITAISMDLVGDSLKSELADMMLRKCFACGLGAAPVFSEFVEVLDDGLRDEIIEAVTSYFSGLVEPSAEYEITDEDLFSIFEEYNY